MASPTNEPPGWTDGVIILSGRVVVVLDRIAEAQYSRLAAVGRAAGRSGRRARA